MCHQRITSLKIFITVCILSPGSPPPSSAAAGRSRQEQINNDIHYCLYLNLAIHVMIFIILCASDCHAFLAKCNIPSTLWLFSECTQWILLTNGLLVLAHLAINIVPCGSVYDLIICTTTDNIHRFPSTHVRQSINHHRHILSMFPIYFYLLKDYTAIPGCWKTVLKQQTCLSIIMKSRCSVIAKLEC